MGHQLEVINGKASMFAVVGTKKELPWHGLGEFLDSPPTIEEGIVKAGLAWQVGMMPLYTGDMIPVSHRALYRTTDKKILGVVGPGYTPLQNTEAFDWFQPIVSSGEASLHTAGSLQEGRKIWILAEINNKKPLDINDGDLVRRFVMLSNSHDGTQAVRIGFTPIRVVCANTLRMAHNTADTSNKLIKINHTKHVTIAIKKVREIMNIANQSFEATAEQYRLLAKYKVSIPDIRKYVKAVLGFKADEDEDKMPTQTINKIDKLVEYADTGLGNNGKTLWDAYNGVTEYLNYEYGRTQDSRLSNLWFGAGADLSTKALEVAIAMAI